MRKTLLTLILSITICATTFAHDFIVDNIYYTIIEGGVEVANNDATWGYDSYSGDVVIPATVTYDGTTYNVIAIGEYAFDMCENLTSVTISEGVTQIKHFAFEQCPLLTNVSIPSSVTTMGNHVFSYCESLTSVFIPKGVTAIGDMMIEGCTSLTSIVVDEENTVYNSGNGANVIIKTAADTLLLGCNTSTIPDGVIAIADYAFNGCTGLTSISIPTSVTSIGMGAFMGCSALQTVDVPRNGLTSIGMMAFMGCENLESITLPSTLTSIGDYAYYGCYAAATIECHLWEPITITSTTLPEPEGCFLVIIPETEELFAAADVWKDYTMSPRSYTDLQLTAVAPQRIYAADGIIRIENAASDIALFDICGRLISTTTNANTNIILTVPTKGIYVVKIGNDAQKVIVK